MSAMVSAMVSACRTGRGEEQRQGEALRGAIEGKPRSHQLYPHCV